MDLNLLDELYPDLEHPDRNLLNDLNPERRVFRFLSEDRFLELVANQKLVLRKPHLWDDPFENFLSKTIIIWKGQKVGFNITNDFFGQCWTLTEECDGFWRSYCSLNGGVRIETTVGKLIHAVWAETNSFRHLQCFVGKIRYLAEDQLKAELQDCFEYGHKLTESSNSGCAQMLLIKRTEFAYEDEVRVLTVDSKTTKDEIEIEIDTRQFIDSIMFAPKTNDARYEAYTNRLIQKGFNRDLISRSTLYDPWTLELPYSS